VETNYAYRALGRLIKITHGVQTRSFICDALDRLKSGTYSESGTTTCK
jgi:YD repeat-containing protein